MLVYGGDSRPTGSPDKLVNTGGRYNPQTDSWTPTSTTNAPLKNNHVAVWTGGEMFVWGGNHFSSTIFREAARYRPSTDSWVPTSNPAPPQAAELGVWSGAELFVLGKEPGCISVCRSVGGRYDPATNDWRSLGLAGAPAGDYVEGAAAVWTGREMILWGGGTAAGARYDPLADAWTSASTANAPAGKRHAAAVWTGSEMLVWGGDNNPEGAATPGGRYDPQTDSWQLMSMTGAPAARGMHSAVWTGGEMVVWGGSGYFAGSQMNTGGRYNPQTDSWQSTSTAGAPEARLYNTAVWTGSEMVVWGGWVYSNEGSRYLNTGGRYNPQTDSWQPTSTAGAPGARSHHRAVWTGSLMVVWGGLVPVTWTSTGDPTYTGARYNPASDSWTPTSLQGAPARRNSHVQVWTGSQMIVWGGRGLSGGASQDGAVYNAPGATPGNTPPAVRLTAPANGAAFQSGNTVRLSVETADTDGTVASVRFYANDALVGTAVQAPFDFDWREVRGGSYSLIATAVDNAGGEGRSAPINITVAPSTEPPVCSLTAPADGSNYAYGASVRLEATATANRDRAITRVEYLVDGRVVTSQEPPAYNSPWPHVYQANEAGARSLAVRCTDNAGAVTASSARTIQVAASGHTVSGQVLDARGFAIAGVRLRLDGPVGAEPRYVTTTTAGNGNYFFNDLKPGESYKVTPEPGEWRFSPESNSYASISKDWPGQNFVGTRAGHGISGHLRDAGGHPIYPATVNLSGSKVASTGTDVNGYYFFSNLPPGGTYTLQPYKNLYSFQPGSRTFENLSAEQTADFTATPQTTTHAVAGRVIDDKGAPVSGLRIRLDTVRVSSTQYRTTDADGRYSFGAITAGETCSLFPEDFTYAYGFTPHFARSYQSLAQNVTDADFVATPRTVGGRVTQSGSGLGGVTVKLEGPQGATATTGADGAFAFRGVTMRGDYTVTATKAGYALTPAQHTIKDLKEDATLGFAAAAKPPPLVQFGAVSSAADERAGSAAFTVTRTGDTAPAVSVNYATSGGTAAAGPDYTAAGGTLNFAEGETQKTLNIALNDDALDEADETVFLTLSSPSGGATLGEQITATLTIADDDAPPSLSIADTSMVEGPGTSDFTIMLSAPSGQTVTVNYATANNTAAAPGDYTAATGTLTFGPGDISKTVTVNVNGDSQDEPDETFFVNLSGATNATVLDAQGVGIISNDDAPRLQFAQAVFPAAESAHYQTVTVTRVGDASAPLTVNYETQDGTASRLSDYTAAVGALEFAAGETSQSFDVLLNDDGHREGAETVRLVLTNPSVGASLGGQATADVLIGASDDPPPASNPIDESATFVRQHYHDFFSREPDAPGLAHWTSVVESCGQDALCREVGRINTSGAFFLSIEFKETGYLVERIYKAAYGDATGTSTLGGTHQLQVPVIRLEEFLPDTQRIGRGVVVHAPGWEAQLEANKTAFTREFVLRERFLGAFPLSMTPAEFVDGLNQKASNVLDANERAALIDELTANNAAAGRAAVLRKIAEDPTLEAAERNRAFVLMQYFGYLRRDPNKGQDMDYTGYDFWLQNLEKAGGNFVQAELVKAFIQSIEYRKRFGQ